MVWTEITPELRQKLRDLKEQTGVTGGALFRGRRHEMPEGLNSTHVQSWLKNAKQAKTEYLEYVLPLWENYHEIEAKRLASKKEKSDYAEAFTEITPEVRQVLRDHRERTGIAGHVLLRDKMHEAPEGLRAHHVKSWLGHVKQARTRYLNYVLELWETIPDKAPAAEQPTPPSTKPNIAYTAERYKAVRELFDRSGYTMSEFWDAIKAEAPESLSYSRVCSMLGGKPQTVHTDHYEFVFGAAQSLDIKRVALTDQDREHLTFLCERSGLSPAQFLNLNSVHPPALNTGLISRWMNGYTQSADKELWDWTTARWQHLADNPPDQSDIIQPQREGYEPITDDMINALKAERERTGIGATQLVRLMGEDKPADLTPNKITAWINGGAKSAPIGLCDQVIDFYKRIDVVVRDA